MKKYLKKLENEFIITKELRIFICTWNMNAEKPDKMRNDFKIMWDFKGKDGDNPIPDVVVIGFQELVDLDYKNTVLSEKN